MARLGSLTLLVFVAGCPPAMVDFGEGPDEPPIVAVDCTSSCADTSTDQASQRCYACQCKSAMDGWLPSVDELQCANGAEIVIYTSGADGALTRVDDEVSTCANPSLLYGNCFPGGTLGQITHGTVTVKYICRRNHFVAGAVGDEALPFDDVGVILYNSRNAASCWFDDVDGTGIAGRNMPDLDLTNGDEANATAFFQYYYYTNGERCVSCHDNDPFNYTPFLQSVGWLTGDYTTGGFRRVALDGTLLGNGSSHLVSADAAACLSCHRITSASTCGTWAPDSFGAQKGAGYEARVLDAAGDPEGPMWWLGTWMPYNAGAEPIKDHDTWESTYGTARDTIQRCCQQPGVASAGCEWEDTPSE